MLEIKNFNEETLKHFLKILPKFWSKYFFRTSSLCDTLVNNMSEAFNSVFLRARVKPMIKMIEEIRVYLMLRWESNMKKIVKYEGDILQNIKKNIAKESKKTNNWIVRY